MKKLCRRGLALTLAALCFLAGGCAPKAMEAFAAWQPEIVLTVGERWEGEIPADGKEASYAISVNTVPGLEARVSGSKLILTAGEPGDGQLTLSATAKGYHDTNLTLPVRVEPKPMTIDWTVGTPEPPAEGAEPDAWAEDGGAALLAEKTMILSFWEKNSPSAAPLKLNFQAELTPPELGTIEIGEDGIRVTAGSGYGSGTLRVEVTAEDRDDASFDIPLTVVKGRLPLSLSAGGEALSSVELENGSTFIINISTGAGAEVEAKLSGTAAVLARNGNALAITGKTPGEGTLVVTASGEGWLGRSLTVPVTVTKTKVVVNPAVTALNVEPGSKETVKLTTKPEGAQVSARVSGGKGITASVSGGVLTVAADENASGTTTITLTGAAVGYADGTASLAATAQLEPIVLTLSGKSVTVEEGETDTLTVSATPEGCDIEVSATDGIEADYDNGILTITASESGTVTVTASMEGREDVTAGVAVTANRSTAPKLDTSTYAEDAAEIIRLTNEYRAQYGLGALSHISSLDTPATLRAKEAADTWSHTRPDGSSFSTVFADYGLQYTAYGENLFAVNTRYTPEEVLQAWKDSPTHDENLLRENFNGIGVGIRKINGEYYYCQLFVER